MTPLPHNPAITVIDLPEDVVSCEVYDKESLPVALIIYREDPNGFFKPGLPEPHHLPPGNYKLICLGNQATEEEAREVVEQHRDYLGFDGYKNYSKEFTALEENYETAKRSLLSLITSNGWKNPVFLRKEK